MHTHVCTFFKVSSYIRSYTNIGLGYMYVSHMWLYCVCYVCTRLYHCKCVHAVIMSLQFITNLYDKIKYVINK